MIEIFDNLWMRFFGLKYVKESKSQWRECYINVGTFFKPDWKKYFPLMNAISRREAIKNCKLAMISYKEKLEYYKSGKNVYRDMPTVEFHKYLIEKSK